MAPRGVATTGTFEDLCWRAPPTAAGESRRGSARCGGGRYLCSGENALACLPSSRASPKWLRVERRRSTFAGARLPPSRASTKGSAWCGGGRLPRQSRVGLWRLWQRLWAKAQLKLFEPATRFSFLKASLKSLATTSHRHMAREKSLPSPGLHDDDYVTASFTSWRHRRRAHMS